MKFPIDVLNAGLLLLGEPTVNKPVYSITGSSQASGTVTLTIGTHAVTVGSAIYVAGAAQTAWNGFQTVTAITSTTVSFASATSGSGSGGTVTPLMSVYSDKASTAFNLLWQTQILSYTLSVFPWNYLKLRVALSAPSLTVTGGTANGSSVTLTVGANTLAVGQVIYLSGTVTSGGTWDGTYTLTGVTPTTLTFAAGFSDTWNSGGTVTWAPVMDWSYIYNLPPDCLRPLRVNMYSVSNYYQYIDTGVYYNTGETMPPFSIENGFLLMNQSSCDLLYLTWDYLYFNPPQAQDLLNLLAYKTATVLAMPITRDPNVEKTAAGAFMREFSRLKLINSQEGTPEIFQESRWITARD